MGCLPFCCILQNIGPKVYAFIAIGCEVVKIIFTILSFFFLEFSILLAGAFMSIFGFFPTIGNIILMIVLIIMISNNSAFAENNSCCKCMCIASIIICCLIFILRVIFFIIFIAAYNNSTKWIEEGKKLKASGSDWAKLVIPYVFFFIMDICQILSLIYLYRLLNMKSSVCYRDYLDKGQISPITVTVSNDPMMKTPQIFPNQLPPPGYQNQLPQPGYPNQLPPPGQQNVIN